MTEVNAGVLLRGRKFLPLNEAVVAMYTIRVRSGHSLVFVGIVGFVIEKGWDGVGGRLFAQAMKGFRLVVVGCWGSTKGFGTGHHDCKEDRSICPLSRGWRSTVFMYFSTGRTEPS